MKTTLALLVVVAFLVRESAQTYFPDLPAGGSRPPSYVKFAAGSLVIDMGTKQIENTSINATSVANLFNLYAYGFAVRLLHANVPLYWAIASNKAKDAVDFTAMSQRIHPTGPFSGASDGPWGSTTPANNTFSGGPLLVSLNYSAQALTVLQDMKSQQKGLARAYSIVIYELTAAAEIDVRHRLTHKPFVAISTLSGDPFNWSPHPNILLNAGFIQGSLASGGHFQLVNSSEALQAFNEHTCYTMFSEPHVIYDRNASCPRCVSSVLPLYRVALDKFIRAGGNFFTQCAGVGSYENSVWQSQYLPEQNVPGAWLSSGGIKGLGNTFNEWGGISTNEDLSYPNPDVPLAQFLDGISGNEPGTVSEFYLLPANTSDSELFLNSGFSLVQNALTGAAFRATEGSSVCTVCDDTTPNLLPNGKTAYIMTVAKASTLIVGGLVVYAGSHNWFSALNNNTDNTYPSGYVEYPSLYNGRRVYLNAILSPPVRPANCSLSICPPGSGCPTDVSFGTCQVCSCVDNQALTSADSSLCTGTCEVCNSIDCVPSASQCNLDCEFCALSNTTGRWDCLRIPGATCPGDNIGGTIGGALGGALGAFGGVAFIVAMIGLIWRLFKSGQVPSNFITQLFDSPNADTNENPLFTSNVTVTENPMSV